LAEICDHRFGKTRTLNTTNGWLGDLRKKYASSSVPSRSYSAWTK